MIERNSNSCRDRTGTPWRWRNGAASLLAGEAFVPGVKTRQADGARLKCDPVVKAVDCGETAIDSFRRPRGALNSVLSKALHGDQMKQRFKVLIRFYFVFRQHTGNIFFN